MTVPPHRTAILSAVIAVLTFVFPVHAIAQSLSVGSASGLPGNSVDLTVSFGPGKTSITALQFDLSLPSSLAYSAVSTGAAAKAVDKSASGSGVTGGARILVYGMNQAGIGAGAVAVVRLSISAGAAAGSASVSIVGTVGSDPAGNPVGISGSGGTVTITGAADTTPPVISAVSVTSVTTTAATVVWTSNEAATTRVEYGTTSGYGSQTGLNSSLVTSHSQTISGLSASTLYHYRARSIDAAGNPAVSADYTFTTSGVAGDTTPPVMSSVTASAISATGALISWTTNEESDSQVEYGTTAGYGSLTALNTSKVSSHSQSLEGLTPSTPYHYRVRSRDAAGNLAISSHFTFTTSAGSDTSPPVISSVSASAITGTGAMVSWTTNENADSQVDYGTTSAYGTSTSTNRSLVATHTQSLTGLSPSILYHFRVRSRDAAGNLATSPDLTFTTGHSDSAAPVISSVGASGVTKTTVLVSWFTDEPADSQVEYGPNTSYGSRTSLNIGAVTAHSQLLEGLTPATVYHCRVKSRDASGNLATSADFTFTTSAAQDNTPPVVSAVTVSGINYSQATVSWVTNEPADSQVEYGLSTTYGQTSPLRSPLLAAHSEVLSGLNPKTAYHFRVKSKDAEGNLSTSADLTFKTTEKTGDAAATLFYPLILGKDSTHDGKRDEQYVGVAIANLDNSPATLTFTAYGPSGRKIAGPSITNPVTRVLNPSEQLPIVDTQLFGDTIQGCGSEGWIKIESNVPRVAGFFLMFNDGVTELDGANVSSHPMPSFVFPELEDAGFTRFDIANPNSEPTDLNFELVRATGEIAAATSRTIEPNEALVADLFADLFPGVTPAASNYVRVTAAKGVLAFEWLGKPSLYSEGLNGQDAQAGGTTLYSPQYAVGGPWRSTLSVVNLDGAPGNVTFRFIRDDATQVGATKVLPIEPHGKIRIDDPAFFQGLFVDPSDVVTQGYVEIVSNGVRLTGSVVFGDPERSAFSAALPLVEKLQSSVLFSQVASDKVYFTGLAILNPNTTDVGVTVDLYASDGRKEGSTVMVIPARQRRSMVLTEYFPDLIGQERSSGYLRLTSDKVIAAFAVFGTNNLSVLSAVPPQDTP